MKFLIVMVGILSGIFGQSCDFEFNWCQWEARGYTYADGPGPYLPFPPAAASGDWYIRIGPDDLGPATYGDLTSLFYHKGDTLNFDFSYWFLGNVGGEINANFALYLQRYSDAIEIWRATDFSESWRRVHLEISGDWVTDSDYRFIFGSYPLTTVRYTVIGIDNIEITLLTGNGTATPPQTTTPSGGCPDGFLQYSTGCYLPGTYTVNWFEAYEFCAANGAHLVEITTQEEQDNMVDFAQSIGVNSSMWAGGSDNSHEGTWVWSSSGQLVDYDSWASGYPTTDTTKNCISMDKDQEFLWVDQSCYNNATLYICELNL